MCTPFFVVKSILGSYGIISSNNNNFIICYYYYSSNTLSLTLSLLGYLKTRICSSKSHVWSPNMTNDTSLESSCALLLESAKNLQICKNSIFYRKIQLYCKNVCKKNLSKKWQIIHFWKALDHAISNMQKS